MVPLTPPFDPNLLPLIGRQAAEHNWLDVDDTVAWLLELNNVDAMAAAVRTAWRRCSLPLREWADSILAVEAFTDDRLSVLGLAVTVQDARAWNEAPRDATAPASEQGEAPARVVVQQAPLPPAALAELKHQWGEAVPAVLWEVVAAAPGLRLNETGDLAQTVYFRQPLRHVRHWLTPRPPPNATFYDDPFAELREELELYLMEVAGDGLANQFLLGGDGGLHFFDYAEPAFRTCRVSIEALVETYFEWPECVLDNAFLGMG